MRVEAPAASNSNATDPAEAGAVALEFESEIMG
jgi:hypothetical protein